MSVLTEKISTYQSTGADLSDIIRQSHSPETLELLLTRRSVVAANQTEPGPTDAELEIILRCATRVPDHAKLTPWRIQVVQGDARERLGAIFADVYRNNNPEAKENQIKFEYQRPLRSPLVLIISTKIESEDRIPRWEQLLSGAAVCQNILVSATALGYASRWLSEWPNYDEDIKAALGVATSDEILGFMYIGSRNESPKERPRPELEDVVNYF